DLGGEGGIIPSVRIEEVCPAASGFRATLADPVGEMLANTIGHEKFRVLRPAVVALAHPDLIIAGRLAMSFQGVLFVRRTVTDVAVQDEEGGAALAAPENLQGLLDAVDIIGIADALDIPAVTQETGRHILGERDVGMPLDRNAVVVV